MSVLMKKKWVAALIVTLGFFTSATCSANGYHSGHYHEGYHGGYYDHGRGWGWGWSGPNVVINVPSPGYYGPVCDTVRVCDRYGHCWLEESCY
jgi:hypothetical protein